MWNITMRRIWLSGCLFVLAIVLQVNGKTIYVDADANGLNEGASWENAHKFLQDALADANSSEKPVEIRVAQGTYKPDEDSLHPDGTGDREATFRLINGVTLQGGYAGFGESDPNVRDIEKYETILSGDLDDNDVDVNDPYDLLDEPTRAENSYHIITWVGLPCHEPDVNTILDGFTISGGNADGEEYYQSCGGGFYNQYSKGPTVANCKFVGNTAKYSGGAIWGGNGPILDCLITGNAAGYFGGGLGSCSGSVKNCTISNNFADYRGGGLDLCECDARIENCLISDNITSYYGGGAFIADASPRLVNCIFRGNLAQSGGGVCSAYVDDSTQPVLIGCTFNGNSAKEDGGGMCNAISYSTLINCIFSGNSARRGGGVYNNDCSISGNVALTNCTFAANTAADGNAMACDSWDHSWPSNLTAANCILWDGGDEIFNGDGSNINITYSDVQDGWPDEGNLDKDPCFADPVNNDYHLKSQAGRWDANDGRWTIDELTSPCIDAGDPLGPIGLEPFPNGGIVNIGAYGGTAEASKSYFDKPPCELIVAGDINGDCKVDFKDFAIMALHWLDNYNQ